MHEDILSVMMHIIFSQIQAKQNKQKKKCIPLGVKTSSATSVLVITMCSDPLIISKTVFLSRYLNKNVSVQYDDVLKLDKQ